MNVEAQARLLVDEAGLPSDAAVIGDASDYLQLTPWLRSSRRSGAGRLVQEGRM